MLYEQALASVFKFLEVAIVKRGLQVFRMANWRDDVGTGIVEAGGCY